jgi:hypothetical protein
MKMITEMVMTEKEMKANIKAVVAYSDEYAALSKMFENDKFTHWYMGLQPGEIGTYSDAQITAEVFENGDVSMRATYEVDESMTLAILAIAVDNRFMAIVESLVTAVMAMLSFGKLAMGLKEIVTGYIDKYSPAKTFAQHVKSGIVRAMEPVLKSGERRNYILVCDVISAIGGWSLIERGPGEAVFSKYGEVENVCVKVTYSRVYNAKVTMELVDKDGNVSDSQVLFS